MKKITFYILSLTWGLPLTAFGAIIAMCLVTIGYRPIRHGGCFCFVVGKNWGGLEGGLFFFVDESECCKDHEFGHAIQNCCWGILTPFVITIPSAIRYWYFKIFNPKKPYYSIWFENQATVLGQKYIKIWGNNK